MGDHGEEDEDPKLTAEKSSPAVLANETKELERVFRYMVNFDRKQPMYEEIERLKVRTFARSRMQWQKWIVVYVPEFCPGVCVVQQTTRTCVACAKEMTGFALATRQVQQKEIEGLFRNKGRGNLTRNSKADQAIATASKYANLSEERLTQEHKQLARRIEDLQRSIAKLSQLTHKITPDALSVVLRQLNHDIPRPK